MTSLVDSWWARPNPKTTILQSLLGYFANTGLGRNYNTPVPLSWSVEHAAGFASAWKHSNDPETMISLASHVLPEKDYALIVSEIARLALPYTYDPRVRHAVSTTERWANGEASLAAMHKAHDEADNAREQSADYTSERSAASAASWLTLIPTTDAQARYFPGRMVVGSVHGAARHSQDLNWSWKKIDGKMAAIIRKHWKPKLGEIVLASRQ